MPVFPPRSARTPPSATVAWPPACGATWAAGGSSTWAAAPDRFCAPWTATKESASTCGSDRPPATTSGSSWGDFLDWCADGADGAAGRLDFVTAWDVLEHLPDLDAYMEALANLLEPGGHLFCTVPNQASPAARVFGRRWNCYLLEHLWYFTPATLRRYLERRGFRIVELATISYPVVLGTILERVRQTYGTPMPRLPRPLARLVLPLPIGLMFAACRRDA